MLILVRHGRTAANAQGLLQGRLDVPLDEVGLVQAAAIAAALPADCRIVASPLIRAQQTAAACGRPVETDERWIELGYGSFEGVPVAEVPIDVWDGWRTDPDFATPGGESMGELRRRVHDACRALAEEAADVDVAVFSHVSPIKTAVSWALGVGPEINLRTHLDHASISRVSFSRFSPLLRSFNETGHLAGRLGPIGATTRA